MARVTVTDLAYVRAERDARLRGLVAVLRLPPLRMPDGSQRRRLVELEVVPGVWRAVSTLALEGDTVTLLDARAGVVHEYRFRAGRLPPWRFVRWAS